MNNNPEIQHNSRQAEAEDDFGLYITQQQKEFFEAWLLRLMRERSEYALNWDNANLTVVAYTDGAIGAKYQLVREILLRSKVVDSL